VISQDRSADAVELEHVLNDLLPMLTAVQPQKLAVTLTVVADALQGRGTQLGTTLDQINSYLKQFDPQLPALDKDIQELVQVTKAYNQAAPDLIQALRDFSVTSQTVASESSNLSSLYSVVTGASQNITSFLNTNQQDIISLSANGLPSLQVLARYSTEFPCVFQGLTTLIPNMDKTLGQGTSQPGLHAKVQIVPGLTPYKPSVNSPQYTDNAGPHCYSVPYKGASASGDVTVTNAGLGPANTPQENELITDLAASGLNEPPGKLPNWSSVLLGPVYRGTTVPVQ
jgi:phospholipid/cholesterol/gamma-HCH transport system substrate-binding protein